MIAGRLRRLAGRALTARGGAPSALVIPVPAAAGAVESWTLAMEPHVTVLYPFVPSGRVDEALLAALREVLGRFPAFPFTLADVRRFPGVTYLAPEPATPFVAMTEACVRRWPAHPPYGGTFPVIVPHLTIAEGPEPQGLAERATSALPIAARASEAWLMTPARAGSWERRGAVPLGDLHA